MSAARAASSAAHLHHGGAATATCTVKISSAADGTTVVNAETIVTVNTVLLHRETNGTGANSGNASKNWVNANIQIAPANATNAVGTNHVLTITINAINGTIDAGPHTATASIVSGPGSFVGPQHLHLHRRRGDARPAP